jgi:hypothetical protein
VRKKKNDNCKGSFYYQSHIPEVPYLQAVRMIRDNLDASFCFDLEDLEQKKGVLLFLLMTYTKCEVNGLKIDLKFQDCQLSIDRKMVEVCASIFNYKDNADEFTRNYFMAVQGYMGDPIDIKNYKRKVNISEDGQSKVMLSTLEPLCCAAPEVRILVIGSASEDVEGSNAKAGRTYQTLIDFLVLMGYKGSITLIDPFEQDREYVHGSFKIRQIRSKYDYDKKMYDPDGKEFTHVFDDVWMVTKMNDVVRIDNYDSTNIKILPITDSKFAYRIKEEFAEIEGEMITNRILEFTNGLTNHSDFQGAQGGGYIKVRGKDILIYGSSNRVPHYDKNLLTRVLTDYYAVFDDSLSRGRKTWDPSGNIFKHYSDAVVSCKYCGETPQANGIVKDQVWYNGTERRFIYNMPDMEISYWFGCGCDFCYVYGRIITNFKDHAHANDHYIKSMLNSVIEDRCIMSDQSKLPKVLSLVKSFSNTRKKVEDYLSELEKKFFVTRRQSLRYLALFIRFGYVSLGKLNKDHVLREYNKVVTTKYGDKYYSKGSDYYMQVGDTLQHYDGDRKKIYDGVILEHRPTVESTVLSDFIRYLKKNYSEEICFIDGFSSKKFKGSISCGLESGFEWLITQNPGDLIIISEYRGWYLVYGEID